MRAFLKSIFSRREHTGEGGEASRRSSAEAVASLDVSRVGAPSQSAVADPAANISSTAQGFTLKEIVADLVEHICTSMPDPRTPEEIDTQIHMYDAGYVTSITAADLLAYIDTRYGVDISETKLIGPLQNLEALAMHIHSLA